MSFRQTQLWVSGVYIHCFWCKKITSNVTGMCTNPGMVLISSHIFTVGMLQSKLSVFIDNKRNHQQADICRHSPLKWDATWHIKAAKWNAISPEGWSEWRWNECLNVSIGWLLRNSHQWKSLVKIETAKPGSWFIRLHNQATQRETESNRSVGGSDTHETSWHKHN